MAIRIKARGGESVEQMLRRFKKLCEKEGLTKDIKRREFYEKPSERKRRDIRKGIARRMREANPLPPKDRERERTPGPGGGGGGGGGYSGPRSR